MRTQRTAFALPDEFVIHSLHVFGLSDWGVPRRRFLFRLCFWTEDKRWPEKKSWGEVLWRTSAPADGMDEGHGAASSLMRLTRFRPLWCLAISSLMRRCRILTIFD